MPRIKWSAEMSAEWDVPRFNRRVRQLRQRWPSAYRVVVKLLPFNAELRDENGELCHALTTPKSNSWLIEIVRNPDISRSIYDVAHEWCHVLEPPGRKVHHHRFRNIQHEILYGKNGLIGD